MLKLFIVVRWYLQKFTIKCLNKYLIQELLGNVLYLSISYLPCSKEKKEVSHRRRRRQRRRRRKEKTSEFPYNKYLKKSYEPNFGSRQKIDKKIEFQNWRGSKLFKITLRLLKSNLFIFLYWNSKLIRVQGVFIKMSNY